MKEGDLKMAKAKLKQEVAVVESQTGLATTAPAYLAEYKGPTGTENITAEDISVPRLKIGQDMSPEVQEGDVERGDQFLNVSGEVISAAGERLPFIVIAYGKEHILWRPKKDNGGGILARARPVQTPDGVRYKWDKPNQTFNVKVEGVLGVEWTTGEYIDEDGLNEWGSENPADKESKKAATEHHNYIIALPTKGNLVCGMSLSKTATGKAKDFNAVLKMGSAPLQSRVFTVETIDDSRDSHAFKNYKFRPAGFVPEAAQFEAYKSLALAFKNKIIDQSDGGDAETTDERA